MNSTPMLRLISLLTLPLLLSACMGMPLPFPSLSSIYGSSDSDSKKSSDSTTDDYGYSVKPAPQFDTAFDHHLYEGYRYLWRLEDFEHDYLSAENYINRANLIKAGQLVEPEPVHFRELSPDVEKELTASRARLMEAFHRGAPKLFPRRSAMAQISYECWMQEAEENVQPHDVEACRSQYQELIADIEASLNVVEGVVDEEQRIDNQLGSGEALIYNGPYFVYFEFDKTILTPASKKKMEQLIKLSKEMGPDRIILRGHADRSGSDRYNVGLSKRRVNKIATIMLQAGLPKSKFKASYFGERKPKVPTPDGQRNWANRRVSVDFQWDDPAKGNQTMEFGFEHDKDNPNELRR